MSSMSRSGVALVFAVAAIALALPAAGAPVEHCVVEVIEQRPDGELITSEPVCFRRSADALAYASDGLIALTEGEDLQALAANGGVRSLSGSFAIGIHYDGFNGSGSSVTIMGSSCSGGWWNTSSAWDNRISSSYNGCQRLAHHDYANKAGQSESTIGAGTTDNLNDLNNRAQSVSYWSS